MQHPDMVHRFFEFLNIESPNNNIHNIRVCRILVATGGVSSRTLSDLQIPSKARPHPLALCSCSLLRLVGYRLWHTRAQGGRWTGRA